MILRYLGSVLIRQFFNPLGVWQSILENGGQVIGQCGNSGHSTEPHIHFHLQDQPNFYLAVGLPVLFGDYEIKCKTSPETKRRPYGYISRHCMVRNVTPDQGSPGRLHDVKSPEGAGLLCFLNSAANTLGLIVWLALACTLLIKLL